RFCSSGGCLVIWAALLFDNCIGKRSADGVVLADASCGSGLRVWTGWGVEENIDALRDDYSLERTFGFV
ncbi:hypothetical protein ACERNI_17150, partial [Camelimonas sp. ID_303_24]